MSMLAMTALLLFALCAALGGNVAIVFYLRKKHRFLYSRLDSLQRTVWDAQALGNLVRPRAPLPQPGGWSASVDLLAEIVRLIETRRPALVVELGSGLSTIVIALKLAELRSGRLVSIDHDETFGVETSRLLQAHGVSELVDLRIAPLITNRKLAPDVPWYDTSMMTDLNQVDLLIIDGPPMPIDPMVRGPALDFFKRRLSPDACIVLDDAGRHGEREIIENWRSRFPEIVIQELPLEKGAALISFPSMA